MKGLINVNKGQDAYGVIGSYILDHITTIEDMIAVVQIDGVITKELFIVEPADDEGFYWLNDWWEGEEEVSLLDYFPVREAIGG